MRDGQHICSVMQQQFLLPTHLFQYMALQLPSCVLAIQLILYAIYTPTEAHCAKACCTLTMLPHLAAAGLVALCSYSALPCAPAAASNGRVFDARSKTWSTGSCPAPPAVAATTAVAGPGGRHSSSSNTSSRGHVGNSSSSSSSIPAGGFGSRSTSSNVALPPTTAGNSGGGMQTSSSSTAQRAKAATQQAELRVSCCYGDVHNDQCKVQLERHTQS